MFHRWALYKNQLFPSIPVGTYIPQSEIPFKVISYPPVVLSKTPSAKLTIKIPSPDPQASINIQTPAGTYNISSSVEKVKTFLETLAKIKADEESNTATEINQVYSPLIPTVGGNINSTDKWSYGKLPSGQEGLIYNDGRTTKYFSGAGGLFFEKYFNNGTRIEPTVVLVISTKRHDCEDAGGTVDKSDFQNELTLANTAKREINEETLNLFNVNKLNLDDKKLYVDVLHNNSYYRCYALCLDPNVVNKEWFEMNKSIILENAKKLAVPYTWKEVNDMTRFYISDLVNELNKNISGQFKCKDVYGTEHLVRDRTKEALKLMLDGYKNNNGVAYQSLKNIYSVTGSTSKGGKPYLEKTITYHVY